MSVLSSALASLQHDPVLGYAVLAAALLALVSVLTGVVRADVAVLLRPRLLLRVLAAVIVAFALGLAAARLQHVAGAAVWATTLAGLERFPLALVALAYGPGVGLVAAGLEVGLLPGGGWHQAVFALELTVLGWLAIYPSPRSSRWAGPFDSVLAYALAWGTGGVALLEAQHGAVTIASLWAQQAPVVPAVLLSSLLLVLLSPRAYQRLFPYSRIAPPVRRSPAPERVDGRDPMKLTYVDLPRVPTRQPRERWLEPLPGFVNEDAEHR